MSDPLSIAAGAAGLISLGIKVTQSLVAFYMAHKGRGSDLARISTKLETLLSIFRLLDDTLQNREFRQDEGAVVRRVESTTQKCEELIHELQEECQKFNKTSTSRVRDSIKVTGRRVAYPFRQSTLQKLDEDIDDLCDNLSLALEVLKLRDNERTHEDIAEIRQLVDLVRAQQIATTILDWLKAPDATINHSAACAKRHPGTGMWFIKSPIFASWLINDKSFLWLHGFAGCGKSVLCSTAIQYAFRHKLSSSRVGIAFFYFTFNDDAKRDESAMLRALLLQLSSQLQDGHTEMASLHQSYSTSTPPAAVLIERLRHMVQKFHHVYIVLDALDESPRYGARKYLLEALETMRQWSLPSLHLLVTSRDELDIRESLHPSVEQEVVMKNADIDRDIINVISDRLDTDPKLRKWLPHRDRIQQALTGRANGMFRWVECQFESLRRCPRSEHKLEQCLQSLPRTLDETYERMLCNIDDGSVEEAKRILTLLCFSYRPLTVRELIDGLAIDLTEPARLDPRRRLQDADDIREICPGLIEVNVAYFGNDSDSYPWGRDAIFIEADRIYRKRQTSAAVVRIAHYSVQEYLESSRILQGKAAMYGLNSVAAQAEMARICLVYLLEPGLSGTELNTPVTEEYPFAHFAAMFWHHHYKNVSDATSKLDELVLALLDSQRGSFVTWVRLYDVDAPWQTWGGNFGRYIPSPIYCASSLGFDRILLKLINTGQKVGIDMLDTAKGMLSGWSRDQYRNPLWAAAYNGHEKVVEILLNAGADVDFGRCRGYETPLHSASEGGHERIVQMLLDAGADVNAGYQSAWSTALQRASLHGHERIVQILLKGGADVDDWDAPLRSAALRGHEKIVQMLLNAGADVNADAAVHMKYALTMYGTALQSASVDGHERIVQILLDAGASVNDNGTSLEGAASGGYEKIVKMLLDAGAGVDGYGSSLQSAAREGHEKIVKMLLDAGADVNAKHSWTLHNTALQAASQGGHETIVQMLLDAGADVNVHGDYFNLTTLQSASKGGHETIVQMLLNAGAYYSSDF